MHRNVYCSSLWRFQARMLHYACHIVTGVQRKREEHGAAGWNQTISLDFRLWQITDDAVVTVLDIPCYSCSRGNAVCRAVHFGELFTAFPLSAGGDGDVGASCMGRKSQSWGSERASLGKKIKIYGGLTWPNMSATQKYPSLDLLNIPQRGRVMLLFSGTSNAGWFITHSAVNSQGEQAGRRKTPLTEWLPLWEVELDQKTPDTPSGRIQDTLAAGTASAAEHSITLRPSIVCKSTRTVGGTDEKSAERKFHVNITHNEGKFILREKFERASPTNLFDMRLNGDVEPQRCLMVVIGKDTFIEPSVLIHHRTLNYQATVN